MKCRHYFKFIVCINLQAWAISQAGMLTLEDAINEAVSGHPSAQAAEMRVEAAEQRLKQARKYQNPSLEAEVENIGGSGEASGTDAAEITVMLSQSISMGGKRQAAQKIAEIDMDLATKEAEIVRGALKKAVKQTFYTGFANQERLALLDGRISDVELLVETSQKRFESGAGSQLEVSRARIEYAQALSERDVMEIELAESRKQLALLLGRTDEDVSLLKADFYQFERLPPVDALLPRLQKNPEWRTWSDRLLSQSVAVDAAKAETVPDVDLGVGWRQNEAEDTESFLFSVGIPLPLFDRNSGARKAEQRILDSLDKDQASARREMESVLVKAWSEQKKASVFASSIQKSVLPAAETAWKEAQSGWKRGRFGYLDLFETQHLLIDARKQYIDALEQMHHSQARLEQLIAGPLNPSTEL